MNDLSSTAIHRAVRENYGKVALSDTPGCGCGSSDSCCGGSTDPTAEDIALALGYSPEEVASAPVGANMGLGCGNPQAIASLKSGETVLDLGSGGGFDCFLAAQAVGDRGHVIGVDMTPEMIEKARHNADQTGFTNVEFRLGEIEHLPVADETADVILSNCVVNLSPDKAQVFREAYRVLKPGGRLAISDIVATVELPAFYKTDLALYTSCMAGASFVGDLEAMLQAAGFEAVAIRPKDGSEALIEEWAPGLKLEDYLVSATIQAVKPGNKNT